MEFIKKQWSNILFGLLVVCLLIPQTRTPIMVFVQRTLAMGPTVKKNKKTLEDYNWRLATVQGDMISFEEAQDRVVMVNFWATWCPPCIAEMPSMQKLYEEYKDEVAFYFVTDERVDKVQSFMEKRGYTMPVYFPQTASPALLEHKALPTTYILAKDGKIHIKETGAAKWDSKRVTDLLDELLKEEL